MDTSKRPPSVEEVDALSKIRRDSSRILAISAVLISLLLLVVVTVGALIFGNVYHQLESGKSAQCAFNRDLATIPVIATGPQATGRVGVKLIADAIIGYQQTGCEPPLPGASPELVELAQKYGISLTILPHS